MKLTAIDTLSMRARASGLLDDYLNVACSGKCLDRIFFCIKKELIVLSFVNLQYCRQSATPISNAKEIA